MSFVQDRWIRQVRHPDGTTTSERTERFGKGMRYKARYTAADGSERSESFPDGRKRQAEAFIASQVTDIARGSWTDPKAARITLRDYITGTWHPAQGGQPNTRDRRDNALFVHILPILGDRTLGDLAEHPSLIQAWIRRLETAPLAPVTIGHILDILSSALTAAVEDGKIPRNPCQSKAITRPPIPKRLIVPWEPWQVADIRAGLPEQLRPLADIGAGLGLRQGEAFGLSPGDIDWLRKTVHVRHQLRVTRGRMTLAPPKRGKTRDVPLPDSVSLILADHLRKVEPLTLTLPWLENDGPLREITLMFPSEMRHALRASNFDRLSWKPALEQAGIQVCRASGYHALRHTFASVLLAGGVDIRKLATYLGHDDPAFTLRAYGHLVPDGGTSMRSAIDAAANTARPRPGPLAAVATSRSDA